jgi:hypothetical protein
MKYFVEICFVGKIFSIQYFGVKYSVNNYYSFRNI